MPSSLFAPPHIPGDAAAEAALDEWYAQHPRLTSAQVDEFRTPAQGVTAGTPQPKRGQIIPGVSGDPFGIVNANALRSASMGMPFDIEAQRNAIALALAANSPLASIPGAIYTGRK